MANRRETSERAGGRGGRGGNKENKLAAQKSGAQDKTVVQPAARSVRRFASMEAPRTQPLTRPATPGPSRMLPTESPSRPARLTSPLSFNPLPEDHLAPSSYDYPSDFPSAPLDDPLHDPEWLMSLVNPPGRNTPPQTPGLSPSKCSASKLNIPPESPYDPLRTPAFRHSPARLPSDQPWRSAGLGINKAVRQLTLGMLVCGEASPNVRGLDVSPIVIVPASERKKRSIFSPPSHRTPDSNSKFVGLDMPNDISSDMFFPSPRRLFTDPERGAQTPSIFSRMEDSAWADPPLDMDSEDPFKAYLDLSPAPKVADHSSPNHPPSSSGSGSPASGTRQEAAPTMVQFTSPTPLSFGKPLSLSTQSRWRTLHEDLVDVDMDATNDSREVGHKRSDSASSAGASSSGSSGIEHRAPTSTGSSSRRGSSPFRLSSRARHRSSSNAGASSSAGGNSSLKSSLGVSVATAGLMDKILGRQDRPQRRRASHTHGTDVSVDTMGSPFKLGKKTSRSDFLYSLDGDCEMQEAQPKKRRRTISGRD
ncbi:hypothetical protein BD413DRAFT_465299 [Trametes elegans]|nr:hypothetical protein BD413DRAFT_465299 [Trametes elegans]